MIKLAYIMIGIMFITVFGGGLLSIWSIIDMVGQL